MELDLGHVSILSKSPFAVLALEEEEGEIVSQNEEGKDVPTSTDAEEIQELENVSDTPKVTLQTTAVPNRDTGIVPRQSLPRLSKDNHRLISNSTIQKTTYLGQSLVNKKSTRKNN